MDKPQSLPSNSNNVQGSTSHNSENTNFQKYAPLYKAVLGGDLDAVTKFLTDHPEAVTASINSFGSTALHVAVMFRHVHIIEKLLQLMSSEDLEVKTPGGYTALLEAARNRNDMKVAKCLVEKNQKLVSIPSTNGWIPVTSAVAFGNIEMANYLYSVTPLDVLLAENSYHGANLLTRCYYSKMFDVALDLLERCPRLAVTPRISGEPTFLDVLATTPLAILEESQMTYWQRWIYKWVHVHQEPASSINETAVSIFETNTTEDDYMTSTSPGLLHRLVSNTLNLLDLIGLILQLRTIGITNLQEAMLAHKHSTQLLHAACNVISTLNSEEMKNKGVYLSVALAAQHGNAEFIVEAIKAALDLLWSKNSEGKRIFHLAVEFRQAKVFNLIHGVFQKEVFTNYFDKKGNNLLHMAGTLAPFTYLNQIPGAALQMQRELQWFKEVESIMPPLRKESLNDDGLTPRQLFSKKHKDLVKQGEKWTKGTASFCTVVAALVATVTFTAAFAVPGGNDQNTGYPMFLKEKLFGIFILSDMSSFLASSTSILFFLRLINSRYAEDDFLKSIPTMLFIGHSTLVISTITMMIAFCTAVAMMFHNKSWFVFPMALLACAPVILFNITLELPLLVDMFKSTYGLGIFERNVEPWL